MYFYNKYWYYTYSIYKGRIIVKKTLIILLSLIISISIFGCVDPGDSGGLIPPGEPVVTDDPGGQEPSGSDEEELIWGLFPFSFSTQDLFGNTVTEETIGEKQLFFVHLWGTWCPPCVNEMPELADIVREYEDRVGFIGLLDDFSSNPDGAINILEASEAPKSFINIEARLPELNDLLVVISQTRAVPTTIIISTDGRMTEPIAGALGARYAQVLDSILEG